MCVCVCMCLGCVCEYLFCTFTLTVNVLMVVSDLQISKKDFLNTKDLRMLNTIRFYLTKGSRFYFRDTGTTS